jgi:hypothetical protein
MSEGEDERADKGLKKMLRVVSRTNWASAYGALGASLTRRRQLLAWLRHVAAPRADGV